MFVLEDKSGEIRMIDFGDGRRVLFRLPVLGDSGVPMLLQTSVAMLIDAFREGSPSDEKTLAIWSMFLEAIRGSYPKAFEHLGAMDTEQLRHVMEHWFTESQKLTGYDPKAL